MSYTPSNISDMHSTVYGSSRSGLLPVWQSASIAFDARTGFFVEYRLSRDSIIRIKIPHFRAVSELASILVRVFYAFSFIINKESIVSIDRSIVQNQLKGLKFLAETIFNASAVRRSIFKNTFSSELDLVVKVIGALQAFIKYIVVFDITTKINRILPNGILTRPNENYGKFDLDTVRIAKISPSAFDGNLEFYANSRSIVPVKAAVLPELILESSFNIDQLVPTRKPTYLPDYYIQPIGYEYVNKYRVSLVTFRKWIPLFFNTISIIHWINAVGIRRLESLEFTAISKFYFKYIASLLYVYTSIFKGTSKITINNKITRALFATLVALSYFAITDNIYIKCILPDELLEESLFEFISTTPIKRRIEFTFQLISFFKFLITFWRDGRPAIRVTTLQHDINRKPRGMIVILEDPTL